MCVWIYANEYKKAWMDILYQMNDKRTNERMNECINEWVNKRTNKSKQNDL